MRRKAIRFGTRRKCRFSIGRRCTLPICYLLGISLGFSIGRRCTLPICYLLGISLDVLFISFFCFYGVFVVNGERGWRV